VIVSIDRVEGLGCFVEVEVKGGGVELIDRVAEVLGVGGSRVYETYVELLLKQSSLSSS
jgi:adenylate cyclase class 2